MVCANMTAKRADLVASGALAESPSRLLGSEAPSSYCPRDLSESSSLLELSKS